MTEPREEMVKRIATVLARHHVDNAEDVADEVWSIVRERFAELVQRHEEEAAQNRARRQT
jgi:dihydroneopterin aldolase